MTAVERLRLPLRGRDMDMLGHLNQAVHHELLEEGRGALVARLPDGEHFEFVLARVELDYRHEVDHRQREVDVTSLVESVGRASITLFHQILLTDGTLAAEGISVLVAWDRDARGSRELTAEERSTLLGG